MEFDLLLFDAVTGHTGAVLGLIFLYLPLIEKCSVINDEFDEDCYQFIMLNVIRQIPAFLF